MYLKYSQIIKILVVNSFKSQLQYKMNLTIRFIASLAELLVNVIFFKVIFYNTHRIQEWEYHEILVLIFIFDFVKNLLNGLLIKNLSKIEDLIANGKFDYYVTKPVDTHFYTSIQQISLPHLIHSLIPLILLIITIINHDVSCISMKTVKLMICILSGVLATYSAWILVMSSCFYIIKIKAVHEIFLEIIQLGKYPKSIYNQFLQILLTSILPVLLIASYPTEIFFNKKNTADIFIPLIISGILFTISRHVWFCSIKKYDSTGG